MTPAPRPGDDRAAQPRKIRLGPLAAFATLVLAASLVVAATCRPGLGASDGVADGFRDKYAQPFASTSIWNMPIGSGAVYVPAGIERTRRITVDEEYWVVTDGTTPLRAFYTNEVFGEGRCATARYEFDLPVPDDLVVPDASGGETPNNAAAFLMPDGRTIVQMNPLARCEPGGPVTAGWIAETVDIYGDGVLGGHGGSHLSSIGGSLRVGELSSDQPIRHALKVNLWGYRFLSRAYGGFRWPATAADSTALLPESDMRSYNGHNPSLRMGALLAIPAHVELDTLGLRTEPARKLAWTLQNYGAYVVDSTGWDAHALDIEKGVAEEFRAAFGFSISGGSGAWYEDMMRLLSALAVVENNGAASPGGGGEPLQPLAPPIGN